MYSSIICIKLWSSFAKHIKQVRAPNQSLHRSTTTIAGIPCICKHHLMYSFVTNCWQLYDTLRIKNRWLVTNIYVFSISLVMYTTSKSTMHTIWWDCSIREFQSFSRRVRQYKEISCCKIELACLKNVFQATWSFLFPFSVSVPF